MARLIYPDQKNPVIASLVRRITRERGSVLNLYAMLLHSPPVAEGWLSFLTAIRQNSSLSGYDRELIILRIAIINRADYEFDVHVPFALNNGITKNQIEALKKNRLEEFNVRARDLILYCDAMTKNIQVCDKIFAAVNSHFNEREMVELTATIAAYNSVSRFLEALRIERDDS